MEQYLPFDSAVSVLLPETISTHSRWLTYTALLRSAATNSPTGCACNAWWAQQPRFKCGSTKKPLCSQLIFSLLRFHVLPPCNIIVMRDKTCIIVFSIIARRRVHILLNFDDGFLLPFSLSFLQHNNKPALMLLSNKRGLPLFWTFYLKLFLAL